ncbi:MAG: hypothetical protein JWQ35_1380 [Bacteriovoracaceae bacterium]|nr:hypothetical protein [Bacteriovoracaceae bacterium]
MRLLISSFLFSIFFVSNGFAAENSYSIKTTTGEEKQVYSQDLLSAYEAFLKSNNINNKVPNGDGTITIFNPQIVFMGKLVPFVALSKDWGNWTFNLDRVCKHFGFGKPTYHYEAEDLSANFKKLASLNDEGLITKFYSSKYEALKSLTCRPAQ